MFGAIRTVTAGDGGIVVRGWVAPPKGTRIAGFRLASGRLSVPLVSWRHGLRDADAARRSGVANCGFEIRASLKKTDAAPLGSLISVTPLVRGRGGWSIFGLWRPSIPTPPKREWALVGSSFLPEACVVLGLLVNDARLAPDDSILDVGCGAGRMAYVLAYYLRSSGRYQGLEPVRRWVLWNRAVLGRRFPTFRFTEFPVSNALYNPAGRLDPGRAAFPVPDSSVDVVLAASVFQHNRSAVVRHYIEEMARVLRSGGRAVITCFLLDGRPSGRPRRGGEGPFAHPLRDGGWADRRDLPESGTAFAFSDFRRWATRCGLSVGMRVRGRWDGHATTPFFQDVVILEKRRDSRRH